MKTGMIAGAAWCHEITLVVP